MLEDDWFDLCANLIGVDAGIGGMSIPKGKIRLPSDAPEADWRSEGGSTTRSPSEALRVQRPRDGERQGRGGANDVRTEALDDALNRKDGVPEAAKLSSGVVVSCSIRRYLPFACAYSRAVYHRTGE